MADFAVQAEIGYRNAARRDNSVSNVQNALSGVPQSTASTVLPVTNRAGDPALSVTVRFVNQADQVAFFNQADALLGTGINGPVAGSRVWMHSCRHDEGVGACAITSERVW